MRDLASPLDGFLSPFGAVRGRAFSPLSLFASGEAGAWYDPSDLSTLWKDTAGTDPVTTAGDTVARVDDKSGNGNNLTQATAAARPVYQTAGGLHWLEFDGVDDFLTAVEVSYNIGQVHAIWVGGEYSSLANGFNAQFFGGYGATNGALRRFELAAYNNSGTIRQRSIYPSIDSFNSGLILPAAGTPLVLGQERESGTSLVQRIAGGSTNTITTTSADFTEPNSFRVGRHGDTAQFLNGKVHNLVAVGRSITADERTALEAYLAAKAGVTL